VTARRLALALLVVAGCGHKKPDPGTQPVAVVQDFEGRVSVKRWPHDAKGNVGQSTTWSADGKRSLEIAPGAMASFTDLATSDWTGYTVLRFTAHNPGERTAALGFEIQDDHQALHDRHQHSFGAPPGDHVIELDFSGGLWRGEENRPYRGTVKTPIDVSRVTRLAFENRGAGPVFVDKIEIVKVPPLSTPGGFAFDFGRHGQQVMAQTTGIFEDTLYSPERGFGFLAKVGPGMRPLSYPTPLLGDGLPLGNGFRVDLPGGAYLGWIAFERGGFSEDEQCGYERADVLVNGETVAGHFSDRSWHHFLFEDTEITDLARIEPDLVRPAHQITRFRFDARAGENVFALAVQGEGPNPLRVAGLIVAPDTPEGEAFLDEHEKRQSAAVAIAYPPLDRARRGPGRAPPASALVAEPLPLGADLYPRDWPEHAGGGKPDEVAAFPDHVAATQLAVYATRPLGVEVEIADLTGPNGNKLPAPVISYGRYMPTRPLGNGPVWIAISHYRPEAHFDVAPDVARAVLFEWHVPKGTIPGVYAGSAVLTAGREVVSVPLRVHVHDVALPPLPIPVGLFMNALPYPSLHFGSAPDDGDDEDRWWRQQDALLAMQMDAGLNTLTGGPGLDFRQQGRRITGERALFYVALARSHGEVKALVNYGGFFPRMRMEAPAADAFGGAWAFFSAMHKLPPFYFVTYDEPGTKSELSEAFAAAQPVTQAGLSAMGFLTLRRDDADVDRLLSVTYAPAMNTHTLADVRAVAARGKHPWVYNNGLDRWAMGLHLWRGIQAGVEGRLEWIGLITQGFAFDDLDGREPANGAFLVHWRFGPMPTPRWLAAREGLFDLRIRLALEAAVKPGDPALAVWPLAGYGEDRARWPEAALAAARAAMLERLDRAR
jgi:hypothetical protein